MLYLVSRKISALISNSRFVNDDEILIFKYSCSQAPEQDFIIKAAKSILVLKAEWHNKKHLLG